MLEGISLRRDRGHDARAQQLADEHNALENAFGRLRGSIRAVAYMVGSSIHDAPDPGDLSELLELIGEKADSVAAMALNMTGDRV